MIFKKGLHSLINWYWHIKPLELILIVFLILGILISKLVLTLYHLIVRAVKWVTKDTKEVKEPYYREIK